MSWLATAAFCLAAVPIAAQFVMVNAEAIRLGAAPYGFAKTGNPVDHFLTGKTVLLFVFGWLVGGFVSWFLIHAMFKSAGSDWHGRGGWIMPQGQYALGYSVILFSLQLVATISVATFVFASLQLLRQFKHRAKRL
ncbi:MAG: hypothetical protein ACOY4R_22375 [Pseudomonadota bacterium]